MKTVWIASLAIAATGSAFAQSTIYKHVDESGRITYTNRPMKGAVPMELEPLTTIPASPAGVLGKPAANGNGEKGALAEKTAADKAENGGKNETIAAAARPALAVVTPVSQRTSLASVEPSTQKRRDNDRAGYSRRAFPGRSGPSRARAARSAGAAKPMMVAAVRARSRRPIPRHRELEFRNNIDRPRPHRGLQATSPSTRRTSGVKQSRRAEALPRAVPLGNSVPDAPASPVRDYCCSLAVHAVNPYPGLELL